LTWITVHDITVAACSCADITQDHECRCTVVPTLADVRAVGFLADSVQV